LRDQIEFANQYADRLPKRVFPSAIFDNQIVTGAVYRDRIERRQKADIPRNGRAIAGITIASVAYCSQDIYKNYPMFKRRYRSVSVLRHFLLDAVARGVPVDPYSPDGTN